MISGLERWVSDLESYPLGDCEEYRDNWTDNNAQRLDDGGIYTVV